MAYFTAAKALSVSCPATVRQDILQKHSEGMIDFDPLALIAPAGARKFESRQNAHRLRNGIALLGGEEVETKLRLYAGFVERARGNLPPFPVGKLRQLLVKFRHVHQPSGVWSDAQTSNIARRGL